MQKIIFIILILSANQLLGAELKIEPIYGFERNYHAQPEPARYKTETFLGVRGTYGGKVLAFEAEISQASSNSTVGETKVKYTTQNLMTGLKLIPFGGETYSVFFRSGLRVQKKTTDITQNGETTVSTSGPNLDPYAGTGVGINLAGLFSLNASATLVYNRNAKDSEKYDTRYTLGAGFKFGNK